MIITPFEDLLREAEEIQNLLEITPSDDSAEMTMRGSELIAYMARSGKMLADARYWLTLKMKDETMQIILETLKNAKYSAKVQNALVDGLCREEKHLVTWLERINASCTHNLDWCRTIISKNKEEMKFSGKQFTT